MSTVDEIMAEVCDARTKVLDLRRQLLIVEQEHGAALKRLDEARYYAWLDGDRTTFPTPPHGKEEMFQQGAWRERRVWWVESRTEKGSIRLALEVRRPNRAPERRFTYTLRVGTADYLAACAEYGLTP